MDVEVQLKELKRMTVLQLRRKYAVVLGEEITSRNKTYLVRRILWGIQADRFGGLSREAMKKTQVLAEDAFVRIHAMPLNGDTTSAKGRCGHDLLFPGSVLIRAYKGRTVRVHVLENGFEHEGRLFRSLSAVAKAVTGSKWNGYAFFNVKRRNTL